MTFTEWQRLAIGVPFLTHGRDRDGWDCWGLVIAAYRDVLGVDLPDFTYASARDYRALAREFGTRGAGYWKPCNPDPMAVACIYRRGRVIHAGLVAGKGRIMHVEEGIETCIEPAARMRIEGYYVPAGRSPAPV